MEAFSVNPPPWIESAIHAYTFCCPHCQGTAAQAQWVWINRRAPVMEEDYRRKWQEFYLCQCQQAWWAWSTDRPPSELNSSLE